MHAAILAPVIAAGLLLGMLLLLEIGRRIGVRQLERDAKGARTGVGTVDGAVFALLGLLLAFAFSGAAARFDARRQLIVEEANAIGTAYLRLDLLAPPAQTTLKDLFRQYLDSRLEVYRRLPDLDAARRELVHSGELQSAIWNLAVSAGREQGFQPATILLLPALNQMIDITTTRTMAAQMHPPEIIFAMLVGLALASALLAGYGMAGGKSRNWLHILAFATFMAVAIFVILDLEYPRLGFIRVDSFDQVLVDLRQSMK